ncbi:MAG TPA: hypothetical protein VH914_18120, partial [Acidimicrobiia bacterium]|nr:hypothetical protein [Acidimicrobiia bacterium]
MATVSWPPLEPFAVVLPEIDRLPIVVLALRVGQVAVFDVTPWMTTASADVGACPQLQLLVVVQRVVEPCHVQVAANAGSAQRSRLSGPANATSMARNAVERARRRALRGRRWCSVVGRALLAAERSVLVPMPSSPSGGGSKDPSSS